MFGRRGLLAAVLPFVLFQVVSAVPTSGQPQAVKRAAPHEVVALLKRAPVNPSDPGFQANYPPGFNPPSGSQIPQLWLDRLRALNLPPCPRSSRGPGLNEYGGRNGRDSDICSFPYGCTAADDLKDPTPGWIGLNFDDGPSSGTDELFEYLASRNATQRATHFMIGSYILNNPAQFQKVVRGGGHIAVHTWSHRQTTTLSNEEIVGELGWTMQIMSDLNGGRIPKFWRPPYGDVDNRVRAIAKGVFGLDTVVWNEDTADWNIGYNPQYTVPSVSASYENLLRGPKSRGLNVLQHEITSACVQVFRNTFPKMAANGWRVGNIAEAFGMDWYQNSVGHGNTDPVASMEIGGGLAAALPSSSSGSSIATSSAPSTTSAPPTSTLPPSTAAPITSTIPAASALPSESPSGAVSAGSSNRSSAASRMDAKFGFSLIPIAIVVFLLI